ncbi:MAG: hypothetical protein PHQ25_04030 [Acidobacteriota bacterium]|nr:hypothetical protein [Acidobacteriota bacterium]MDW3228625.1 hypothetical protein [Acidobacteriota bacterium]
MNNENQPGQYFFFGRPVIIIGIFFFVILINLLSIGYAQNQNKISEHLNSFITWRNIGPALPGGRTVDLAVVENEPWVIYAAVGPSGLWKSENNGISWFPVFYREATVSVGAVAVAQSSPEIVWVGSGEASSRNSVTIGDGVYKSIDGGKTWTNMGLKETRHISRIIISRGDPNIVYVAALGHLWGPNTERGVFKTIDGGKTWQKVLYINADTGICDLEVDPGDSQILYAAAYEHRRKPYHMVSGGPGSGVYKSSDGGLSWEKLKRDLPEGIMGRIGLAVARNKPGVVYALIEHQEAGIWRSEDHGQTWKRTCDSQTCKNVNNRPFYYSHIYVDPHDDQTIYVQSTGLYVSKNMGQKFQAIGQGIHPDHHALWIDPDNPLHLIDGNDGGIDITYDGGKTWMPVTSIDAAEVYQIGYDFSTPYRVYCGLQDNGCWGGLSNSLDSRGILNEHWEFINGGDGFFVRPDPKENFIVYTSSQNNGLVKKDLRHGLGKGIKPVASLNEPPYRFNWNAPLLISPHDNQTIYCGGNYLFRSVDGGYSWEKISPDLTTNDPEKKIDGVGPITIENSGAEIHCTITAIAESPVKPGIFWCGTDDGNIQLSRDGGKKWFNLTENIPHLPKNSWCSRIEPSHFNEATAYVSFDNHRTDDYSPYVYKTTDFGRTWKSIRSNLPDLGWIHVIREHPANDNLLFVGTEFGIYVSYNSGLYWIEISGTNLPTVSVHDIAIHPQENDLIIGTHGRGIWVLDDIVFLSELNEDILNSEFHLFISREANQLYMAVKGDPYTGAIFRGKNPSTGANITYFKKGDLSGDLRIIIVNSAGENIMELPLNKKAGFSRTIWNLQFLPPSSQGKKRTPVGLVNIMSNVIPDDYLASVKINDKEHQTLIRVSPDPRFKIDPESLKKQYEPLAELVRINNIYAKAVATTRNIIKSLEFARNNIGTITDPKTKSDLESNYKELLIKFNRLSEIFQTEGTLTGLNMPYEKSLRGPLNIQLLMLIQGIASFPSQPTATELQQIEEIARQIISSTEDLNRFIKNDLEGFNQSIKSIGLSPPEVPGIIDIND